MLILVPDFDLVLVLVFRQKSKWLIVKESSLRFLLRSRVYELISTLREKSCPERGRSKILIKSA